MEVNFLYLSALSDHVLIDGILGICHMSQIDGPVPWIDRIFVHEDFRRNGVATALLNACIKWCQEHEKEALSLGARNDNEPALALYRKLGFRRVLVYDNKIASMWSLRI